MGKFESAVEGLRTDAGSQSGRDEKVRPWQVKRLEKSTMLVCGVLYAG